MLEFLSSLVTGSSGNQGTASVMQLTAMQEAADKAAANQRTLIYVGGGALFALAIGGALYYGLRK